MKHIKYFIFILFFSLNLIAEESLNKLIEEALKNNPQLQAKKNFIEVSKIKAEKIGKYDEALFSNP
jgi:hypothetical protein